MMAIVITQASKELTFSGMNDLGIAKGFDLQFTQADKSRTLHLCLGKEDNRVLVTGTTPMTRQAAVLKAIDDLGQWAQPIKIWLVGEKTGGGSVHSPVVDFITHVKPLYGKLTIGDFASADPALTYPGNGSGRVLSHEMNGRYYFEYGGLFERNDKYRGFDCTTFPMALLSIAKLPSPGYGKQLCTAVGAVECGLEQMSSKALSGKFKEDSIPRGLYILFSAAHVMLYNSDINTLYEFNFGGFKKTPAAQRHLSAPQDLWWMRKLNKKYRPCFEYGG
jgi:hypothetical protein